MTSVYIYSVILEDVNEYSSYTSCCTPHWKLISYSYG